MKEGWYDGGSIAFAVFLVIIVTGTEFDLIIVSLLELVHWLPPGWKVTDFVELTVIWVLKWFLKIVYFVFFHPLKSKSSNSDWALISTKFENFLTSKLSLYDVLFLLGVGKAYAYNIFRLTWLVGPFCVGYSTQICNKSCRLAWTCQCSLELFLF